MTSGTALARSLAATLGGAWSVRALGASGFAATWHARQGAACLFVKTLPLARGDVLEAEADGLAALADAGAIRAPAVQGCWRDARLGEVVLALEWLALAAPDPGFGARLGHALAQLHRQAPREGGGRFGWRRDNRIGATPQRNRWSAGNTTEDWIEFLRAERFEPLCDLLAGRDPRPSLIAWVETVSDRLPALFADGHEPRASLIHGDLWSGNWGMLGDGTPVVYDPAVSCSDAEAELAMMELFGQPPAGFWAAYRQGMPLHPGYPRRRSLYQLYHLLNHAVLFGGGYVQQAEAVARSLAG